MNSKIILALCLTLALIDVAPPLAVQEGFVAVQLTPQEVHAKAAETKSAISIRTIRKSVQVGKKIILNAGSAKQKVKWSVSDRKAMKIVKVYGKNKQKVELLAQKTQKVTVTAKTGKKWIRYNINITAGKVALLKVLDDVVTSKVRYGVVNGTDKGIKVSSDLALERYDGKSWVAVPVKEYAVSPTAWYFLKANARCTKVIFLDWLYGELVSGKYRLSKPGIGKSNSFIIDDMKKVSVSIKFDVTNRKKITLTVFNKSAKDISINPFHFSLQKLVDGIWADVAGKESDSSYPAVMQTVKSGQKWSKEIILDDVYSDTSPGDYVIEVVGAKRVFFTLA